MMIGFTLVILWQIGSATVGCRERIFWMYKHRYLAWPMHVAKATSSQATWVPCLDRDEQSLPRCSYNCIIKANTSTIAGARTHLRTNAVLQTTWRHESVDASYNTVHPLLYHALGDPRREFRIVISLRREAKSGCRSWKAKRRTSDHSVALRLSFLLFHDQRDSRE